MGSFRFRKVFKVAPGVRVNVNKRSVGISGGVPGARASVNSSGQRTRSLGIPGTGLYFRWQKGGKGGASGGGSPVRAADAADVLRLEDEMRHAQQTLDAMHNLTITDAERAQIARDYLPDAEVAQIEGMTEDEAEASIGPEALQLKRNDPAAFKQMLSVLEPDDRQRVLDAVARAERNS